MATVGFILVWLGGIAVGIAIGANIVAIYYKKNWIDPNKTGEK